MPNLNRRLLADNHVISRAKPANANQNVYYVEAGPEGKMVVLDLNVIPMSVILACLAWEADHTVVSKDPIFEFNKTGFVY